MYRIVEKFSRQDTNSTGQCERNKQSVMTSEANTSCPRFISWIL